MHAKQYSALVYKLCWAVVPAVQEVERSQAGSPQAPGYGCCGLLYDITIS